MRCTAGVLLLSLLAACGRGEPPEVDRPLPACAGTSDSNLPGVSIVVRGPCTFTLAQAAAGVDVAYDVVVDAELTGVEPAPQDAGGCGRPGASGLILFESLSGGGHLYALLDSGLCEPSTPSTTLPKGTWTSSFHWTGRNWEGPSDTGNPMGAPFPAGSYTFRASAVGRWNGAAFEVRAAVPVTLVE